MSILDRNPEEQAQEYYERAQTAEARSEELESDLEHARWEIAELEQIVDEYQDARRSEQAALVASPT